MEEQKLFAEIDRLLTQYERPISLDEGLDYSQRETVRRIFFYSLSEYLSGNKDRYGRRKPFRNVVNEKVDTEARATDPDLANIQLKAEGGDVARTMLLRRELLNWAKETDFSQTLNDLNEVYVRYGGVLAKKTIDKGQLIIEPVSWKDVKTDQIDIESGAIVEHHWLSPSQLRAKKGAWENIEDAVALATKTRGDHSDEGTTDRIEVLEITGEFERQLIDEEADEDDYTLMKLFVATHQGEKVLLFKGEIKETGYKYKARKKHAVPGRALGLGVVEEGFEAQISINEAAIAERLAFELGGKILAKTNSPNAARHPLTEIEDGHVFELEGDEFFENMTLMPSTLPEYQNLIEKWEDNYRRQTGSFEAVTGEAPKSGTPFRSLALQSAQASSGYDYRGEEFNFLVKEILKDWVLPYLAKKIDREHILESEFSPQELQFIDDTFALHEATKEAKEQILSGNTVSPVQYKDLIQSNLAALQALPSRRIDMPKNYFKDIIKKLTILIDDEQEDRKAQMQTLFEIYQTMQPGDPDRKTIFDKMIELSGAISPASLIGSGGAPADAKQGEGVEGEIESVMPEAQQ